MDLRFASTEKMTQNKGLVVLVEDNLDNQQTFDRIFNASGIGDHLNLKIFGTVEAFVNFSQTDEFSNDVRLLIFDLANNVHEENAGGNEEFAISQYIRDNYNKNRVPIIIHSGYIHKFNEFDHKGTVFKEERSDESVEKIIGLIKLLQETGFLNVFRINGYLENKHPDDLHRVFTSQFRDRELPALLKLLHDCHGSNCLNRVNDIFQRLALRALIGELTASKVDDSDQPDNPKLNVVEHFYRRTNRDSIALWTGDIFSNKNNGNRFYILTPRCDLANKGPSALNNLNVLVCPVEEFRASDYPDLQDPAILTPKKAESQRDAINNVAVHHPKLGIGTRFIPKSPFLPTGGRINFSSPQTFEYRVFAEGHDYLVTLSDDFVNEVAARFGAYLMRPGIAEIDIDELQMFKV